MFPKLASGQVRPAFGLRRLLGDFQAHRIYFGGDEHFFLGPKRELRGLRAAGRHVQATMDELDIEREELICLGTSAGAVGALLIGLEIGVGTIIAGAPSSTSGASSPSGKNSRPRGRRARRSKSCRRRATRSGGEIEFLDSLIPTAAAKAEYHSRVILYTSFFDDGYLSTMEFVERYRSHPLLSIVCTHGTYAEYGEIGAPFKEFLQKQFTTLDV